MRAGVGDEYQAGSQGSLDRANPSGSCRSLGRWLNTVSVSSRPENGAGVLRMEIL